MFDPVSLWMQGTVMWMKVFKQQQDAYLRLLGAVAVKLPHESSGELAREAEAVKKIRLDAAKHRIGATRANKSTHAAEPDAFGEDALIPV